jgi:hypothetical protein
MERIDTSLTAEKSLILLRPHISRDCKLFGGLQSLEMRGMHNNVDISAVRDVPILSFADCEDFENFLAS